MKKSRLLNPPLWVLGMVVAVTSLFLGVVLPLATAAYLESGTFEEQIIRRHGTNNAYSNLR